MPALFEKTTLKNLTLKNRFFRSATWESAATEDGHLTPRLRQIYLDLAKGGVGSIFTGYANVWEEERPNPRMMGIYDDSFVPEYRELTDSVHEFGCNLFLQIAYGGSKTSLNPPSPVIWGPSAVKEENTGVVPREITREEMARLAQAFAAAAGRAKQAGFDGVELHCAHGYLLSQFLNPLYNLRQDEYGGSLENRARYPRQVLESIRQEVGEDYPVLMKIDCRSSSPEGITPESCRKTTALLAPYLDGVEVSGNWRQYRVDGPEGQHSFFQEEAAQLAEEVALPVILTGGNRDCGEMQQLLDSTRISYFAVGRPLVCQPDLVARWEASQATKPRCVSCGRCFQAEGKNCVFH